MTIRSVMLSALVGMAVAAPAAAQAPQQSPLSQSIGGGAQWAFPVTTSELNGTPGLNVSWRGWATPHFGIEGTFAWWQDSRRDEFSSGTDRYAWNATVGFYNVGMNVMGRVPVGKASIIAGGGPAWFFEHVGFDSTFSGQTHSASDTAHHFGIQGLTEIEVPLNGKVSAFGGLRYELRDVRYGDSGFVYPLAGVRFNF